MTNYGNGFFKDIMTQFGQKVAAKKVPTAAANWPAQIN
eukprot:CAMPEP_0114975712 /NCGR_PEP_ID=MMETSP0216-20121206/2261_1 /TAXON_ID=223996 /ORGANISM="Protocruzia adherens, Strain Boccale" /LENGTH=37 /DNA_ID= /DNA_START= /DNA_END= /DNA_ORIENTATION=